MSEHWKGSGASAQAIQFHYDTGNDFFRLWLDETMTYSCAMWEPGDSLANAQRRKIDYHVGEAKAGGKARVLEVGSGWGGVLRRLVEAHNVSCAVGLTLSRAQADWTLAHCLPGIQVRLENWVDHTPSTPYDTIISIGAFEHFARLDSTNEERLVSYSHFFQRSAGWLRKGGRLALQTFAYGDHADREATRKQRATRFLANDIFPETDPPCLTEIIQSIAGHFELVNLRNDRLDYSRTCAAWLSNLRQQKPAAVALVGEETFANYEQYLQLSQIAFHAGRLHLYRITLACL